MNWFIKGLPWLVLFNVTSLSINYELASLIPYALLLATGKLPSHEESQPL